MCVHDAHYEECSECKWIENIVWTVEKTLCLWRVPIKHGKQYDMPLSFLAKYFNFVKVSVLNMNSNSDIIYHGFLVLLPVKFNGMFMFNECGLI